VIPRRLGVPLTLCWFACTASAAEPARPTSSALRATAAAYSEADRAFQGGDLARARDLSRELTQRFPDDPQIWLRLAVIEEKLGAFDRALTAYDTALDVEAAYSIDGGRTLARIHLQRAMLLVAEAERDLAASGDAPLGESFDARRLELRRALAQNDSRARAAPAATRRRDDQRAHGYVVETPQGAATATPREDDR
jgi:tetratricopeptide (TPR) repeat protein